MGKKDLLELDTRRDIYTFIKRNPGTHLRGVERQVNLPFGQVLYHLDYLEKNGLIVVRKDGGFKRYFVKHHVGRLEKTYISAFRHELPRKISILLLLQPDITHKEILDYFDVSGSTLSFHLNKMVESGLVVRRQAGNENYYRMADERTAAKILVLYRESFTDEAVDRFADVWLTLNYKEADHRLATMGAESKTAPRVKAASSGSDLAVSVLHG